MINELLEIIKVTNKIILDIYNKDFYTEFKDDNSPLTEADKKASDYICSNLKMKYPNIPIICEETKQVEFEKRKDWDMFWLIDPLDGTKEFIKKNGEFTVNIALIKDREPILGIVSIPCKNLIYFGEKNKGAFRLNILSDTITDLQCKNFNINDKLTIVCSRSHMNDETKKYCDKLQVKNMISYGSSLKFLCICENEAQIYPRLGHTMEWDIAAADIILRECGGSIKLLDGSVMNYNKENLLNPYFIAFGKNP